MNQINNIVQEDSLEVLKILESESIDCVITSPPYWALRDYGVEGQLGLEPTFQEYITKLCDIFDEVKRVLKKDGTCWVNIGDTYGGSGKGAGGFSSKSTLAGNTSESVKGSKMAKESWSFDKKPLTKNDVQKCLCQIPSRFSIEMTNRGWILRNEIIWHKPNCMPSSVRDRFTVDFEKVFFFVKSKKYHFQQQFDEYTEPMNKWGGDKLEAKGESTWDNGTGQDTYRDRNMRPNKNGKNKRTEKLIKPMILAGCPKDGIVLDIFMGAGTTGVVAKKNGRNYLGIELNPEYIKIAEERINGITIPLL